MTLGAEDLETLRAEQARANLLRDIQEIKKVGHQMIEHTEAAIHKAPVWLGLGAASLALVGVAVLASRRSAPRFPAWQQRERSFFAEAARGAALSALGIVSARITQRLLTAALAEPTESA